MGCNNWLKPSGFHTGVRIYNCIAKEKVPLIVRDRGATSWYTCGPTVYDSAHIGHASSYVKLDIIKRILRHHFGVNLVSAMNITDVDDKIIKRSVERRVSIGELTQFYEKEFWNNMDALKVQKPDIIFRISEHIGIIEEYIVDLVEKGHAYKAGDNSVYFNTRNVTNYGKLQNIGEREEETNNVKRSSMDFALWKAAKDGEPFWESKWGPGRPGWHTECAALAGKIFGSTLDIHAGGIDLRFPHHENEEAQSCAHFSQPQWVNYWLHTGHLSLKDSVKMSKSLNNTLSISYLLDNCSADEFRMMCLMSHYRSPMEFNDDYVRTAANVLKMYKNFVNNCRDCLNGKLNCSIDTGLLYSELAKCVSEVREALSDDFDTASVLKSFNSLITTTNKMLHTSTECLTSLSERTPLAAIVNFLQTTFTVFGFNFDANLLQEQSAQINVADVLNILNDFRSNVREIAKENKSGALLRLCDNVRDDLKDVKVVIKDHGKVSTCRYILQPSLVDDSGSFFRDVRYCYV